jgi:hypothetical protein
MGMYNQKPKMTQEHYDSLVAQVQDIFVGRGNLYSSVTIAWLNKELDKYDLSDIIMVGRDPMHTIILNGDGTPYVKKEFFEGKKKRNWFTRLWMGE